MKTQKICKLCHGSGLVICCDGTVRTCQVCDGGGFFDVAD